MTVDLSVRKPFNKITPGDLAAFPVWEWAMDEEAIGDQDESFVRPAAHACVPKAHFAQYLVSAKIRLRDGSNLPGCVEVTVQGRRRQCVPTVVFLIDRHLNVAGSETSRLLSRYTKKLNNYPVRWELTVPFAGEAKVQSGRIRRSLMLQIFELWMQWKFLRTRRE